VRRRGFHPSRLSGNTVKRPGCRNLGSAPSRPAYAPSETGPARSRSPSFAKGPVEAIDDNVIALPGPYSVWHAQWSFRFDWSVQSPRADGNILKDLGCNSVPPLIGRQSWCRTLRVNRSVSLDSLVDNRQFHFANARLILNILIANRGHYTWLTSALWVARAF
jgi:hypothetical protein